MGARFLRAVHSFQRPPRIPRLGAAIISTMTVTGLSLQAIEQARTNIRDAVYLSPCRYSADLSQLTGQQVYLKLDNLQRTGSFKERGALNKIISLTKEQQRNGVVAASAGNHAQGVAYHAARHGIRAEILMPLTTPLVKVTSTQRFGADVILFGNNYDEACTEALRRCEEQQSTFLHPFDDLSVIAGQGTIGLELLDQIPGLEAVVVPIGGGGLISGVACALKESNSNIRVIGVQTERLPSMLRAREHGSPITVPAQGTIADGIAVRTAGDVTFPLVQKYVDEIVTVDEEEIANAILVLLEREKTLAEGAGAVALAAVLQHKFHIENAKIAVLVCGGNIDVSLLSRIIERGLVKDGRRVRIRVHLPDRPGALHQLTGILARQQANIVETSHNRSHYGVSLGNTAIDLTLETRGASDIKRMSSALIDAGYRHELIQ